MLTTEQATTLATHIRANADPAIVAALPTRVDSVIATWYNAASTSKAWVSSMTGADLFGAMDVTKFDSLTAGKRDAWRLMLDFAPIDCTRNANRKAILDVWGATDSVSVLNSCTRTATKAEEVLGGNSATTNTVSALKLNWEGTLSVDDVSRALNDNP
jgi:hypothetical protein